MIKGEVTLKSTLTDCLQILRQELAVCSKNYNGMEPARGLEEAWQIQRKEVDVLQEHIHALESETVRQALASWQVDVMEHGPSALQVEEEPVRCPYFKEMFRTCDFDNTFVCAFSAEYKNCSWYRMKMTGRPVFYEGRHQKKDVPDHPEG